jgi:hypothetical protein
MFPIYKYTVACTATTGGVIGLGYGLSKNRTGSLIGKLEDNVKWTVGGTASGALIGVVSPIMIPVGVVTSIDHIISNLPPPSCGLTGVKSEGFDYR